jgi:hypothetical protein
MSLLRTCKLVMKAYLIGPGSRNSLTSVKAHIVYFVVFFLSLQTRRGQHVPSVCKWARGQKIWTFFVFVVFFNFFSHRYSTFVFVLVRFSFFD